MKNNDLYILFSILNYQNSFISSIKYTFLPIIAVVAIDASGKNHINTAKPILRALAWLQVHQMEGFLMVSKKLRPFPVVMNSPFLLKIK